MSTIASPREPSGPFRRTNSTQALITPTSSSRPSLDVPPSASGSPNPSISSTSQNKRANRAALREYYNLRNNTNKPLPSPPTVEVTTHPDQLSDTTTSELDHPSFDAASYLTTLLSTSSLADLLRVHTRILSEMRALDAEKKALVYDNYSKLIAATETIRRMRATEHGEMVQGGSVEKVVEGIYEMARGLREEVRRGIAQQEEKQSDKVDDGGRRERTRELAREVVAVVGRVRALVGEGRVEEARGEWEVPRRLLVRWREMGVGGGDVEALIEEGDALLRGERGMVASPTT